MPYQIGIFLILINSDLSFQAVHLFQFSLTLCLLKLFERLVLNPFCFYVEPKRLQIHASQNDANGGVKTLAFLG